MPWQKSWIINAILTGRFIYKQRPFIAFLYFFPLVTWSLLRPCLVFQAIVYAPTVNVNGLLSIHYVLGPLLAPVIVAICYRLVGGHNRYLPYLFLWWPMNIFVLSFYAVIRLQDRGWGTR
jgi:hypothetical protein